MTEKTSRFSRTESRTRCIAAISATVAGRSTAAISPVPPSRRRGRAPVPVRAARPAPAVHAAAVGEEGVGAARRVVVAAGVLAERLGAEGGVAAAGGAFKER